MPAFTGRIPRGLIVSCQAVPGEALYGPTFMAAMARAAAQGGAVAIRADGAADIAAISAAVALPVVGVRKRVYPRSEVHITPTFAEAREAVEAGAAVVAVDGTARPRPAGETLEMLIGRVHLELQVPVLADVASVDDGRRAAEAGADAVASTLSGYVANAVPDDAGPDVELVRRLAAALRIPVLAEGRYRTAADADRAMDAGAYGVVVGTAITRPSVLTAAFAAAIARRIRPPG